jgi:hypothetical protein
MLIRLDPADRPRRGSVRLSIGFCVAESPMRTGDDVRASSPPAIATDALTLVVGHSVNPIDNHRFDIAQNRPALLP